MSTERPAKRARFVRERIWDKLRPVARPDSRFHLDFAKVIPDFEGGDLAITRLRSQPHYLRIAANPPLADRHRSRGFADRDFS